MTRRRSLTPEQIRQAKALHRPGIFGYERIGKKMGIPASTIRDCIINRSAYALRVK